VKDDDLAPVRVAEAVDEAVGEHAVGEAGLAVVTRASAQCSVGSIELDGIRYGVDDPGLDREHDADRGLRS
jgi:hypothetical protein